MAAKLVPIKAWNSSGRFPAVSAFLERNSVEDRPWRRHPRFF